MFHSAHIVWLNNSNLSTHQWQRWWWWRCVCARIFFFKIINKPSTITSIIIITKMLPICFFHIYPHEQTDAGTFIMFAVLGFFSPIYKVLSNWFVWHISLMEKKRSPERLKHTWMTWWIRVFTSRRNKTIQHSHIPHGRKIAISKGKKNGNKLCYRLKV